jgi:hypothetical protein
VSQYEDLQKAFDGTIESVPPEIEAEILDHYADADDLQAFCGEHDIPADLVRVVLEQPDLMQKALDRQRGVLTLQYVSKVLPAAMKKAAEGDTGAIQAAKLVADAIGAHEGRPVGRPPKKQDEQASGPSLEDQLKAIKQTESSRPKAKRPQPVKPKRSGKARSKLPRKGNR